MASLVYAAPYPAPTPPLMPITRKGMRHTWTGWDGSVWDLSDPAGGVVFTADGIEGLRMPNILNYTHDSPVVHGVSWDGWLATGRKVFWPVLVYTGSATDNQPSSEAWINRNRAFWQSLRPGKVGTWTVHLPTGQSFNLRLRFGGGEPGVTTRDPVRRGWEVYGIEMFPEQPFWEATPIVESWGSEAEVPFLGPADIGPPFHVSPASTIDTATVTNPGDVESYIQWTITGPTSSVTVGIGGENTVIPFRVPDGEKLIIDTDPRNLIAELNGVDVMNQLREFNYPALPPGEDIALSLAMEGNGSVEARFTPYMLMGL